MTKKRKLTKEESDKEHERQLSEAMAEALDPDGVHFIMPLEENPRLQVFNQVMREQARRKVN